MFVYLCKKEGVQTRMLGAGLFGEKGYSYEDPYIAAASHLPTPPRDPEQQRRVKGKEVGGGGGGGDGGAEAGGDRGGKGVHS